MSFCDNVCSFDFKIGTLVQEYAVSSFRVVSVSLLCYADFQPVFELAAARENGASLLE